MMYRKRLNLILAFFTATVLILGSTQMVSAQQSAKVFRKTVKVGDLDIFYREVHRVQSQITNPEIILETT